MQHIVHYIQFICAWVYTHTLNTNAKAAVTGSFLYPVISELSSFSIAHLFISIIILFGKGFIGMLAGLIAKSVYDLISTKGGRHL